MSFPAGCYVICAKNVTLHDHVILTFSASERLSSPAKKVASREAVEEKHIALTHSVLSSLGAKHIEKRHLFHVYHCSAASLSP